MKKFLMLFLMLTMFIYVKADVPLVVDDPIDVEYVDVQANDEAPVAIVDSQVEAPVVLSAESNWRIWDYIEILFYVILFFAGTKFENIRNKGSVLTLKANAVLSVLQSLIDTYELFRTLSKDGLTSAEKDQLEAEFKVTIAKIKALMGKPEEA